MISTRLSLFRLFGAVLFICAIAGLEAQAGSGGTRAARAAIEENNRIFMEAVQRNDVQTILTLYSPEAVLFPPEALKISGVQQLTAYFEALVASSTRVELVTTEFEQHGNTSIEVGIARVFGDGPAPIQIAKFLIIWKREHGVWKIYRDIFNTDPLPEASAESTQSAD